MWTTCETNGPVAVLKLAHGDQNRISGPFCDELRQELAGLAQNKAVAAVVVIGQERFFSNGLDLEWMKAQTPEKLYAFLLNVSGLLKDTALFPKPLIAAVSGHAFGLGAIWASGFDFRIMNKDKGWVCFPEMDINIPFSPGMIAICEHGLGTRLFRDMAWSAARFTGEQAHAIGWATGTVAADEVLPKSLELAQGMAQKGAEAFAMTKIAWAREVVRALDELDPAAYKKIPLKL